MQITGGSLRLRDALIHLLHKKMYSEITITDITRTAKMNRTSFYLFFENKEDLVRFTSEIFLEKYCENLVKSYDLHPDDENLENIQKAFQYIDAQKEVILALWSIKNISFSPFTIMQDSIKYQIQNYLEQNTSLSIKEEMIPFYSDLYAVSAMTTIKWWLETTPHPSYERTAKLIDTCCTKGLNCLLIDN